MTEAFICDAIRTPVGRYNGGLAAMRVDDLAAHPIKALMQRNANVDWGAVDDVIYGCVNQAGEDNRNVARMAGLLAGLPVEVAGATVNRLCGSGLEAAGHAARAVKLGEADMMIAGGVEGMTRSPYVMGKPEGPFDRIDEARGHGAGLALRQSAHEGGLRRRPDGPDRRERRRRAPDQPHRPGRLRLSQPAPLQGGAGSRLLRQGDRQGLRQEGQDRDHRRQGRASARRHHDGDPVQAAGGVPRGRLGDGGQLVGHQRRRLRHDHRLRGGGQGQRPDAARAHPGHRVGRRAAARHGHRPGAGDAEAAGQARHDDRATST